MRRWWETMVLVAAGALALPFLFLTASHGYWALLGIPIEAIAAFAIYRQLRAARLTPSVMDPTPRPDRRPPVAPVDDEAISALPEPLRACPDCAFIGVRMPQIGDGLWPGGGELGDRIVCPRCGYQGIAVTFDKREQYGEFLRALASPQD